MRLRLAAVGLVVAITGALGGVCTGPVGATPSAPAAPASGWSASARINAQTGYLSSVSCPTVTFCAATDQYGNVTTFDGHSWSAMRSIAALALYAVSCASPSFCVAVDQSGNALSFDGTGCGYAVQYTG